MMPMWWRRPMNRVLAVVFTIPFVACSERPNYEDPSPANAGSPSGGSAPDGTGGGGGFGITPGGGPGTGGTPGSAGGSEGTCPPDVTGHCSSATYPTYPGFQLALVEDFDEPLDLDSDPIW